MESSHVARSVENLLEHVPDEQKVEYLDSYLKNDKIIVLTEQEKNIVDARHEAKKKPGKRNQELIDQLRKKRVTKVKEHMSSQ